MSDFGHVKLTDDGQRKYEQVVTIFEATFEALKAIVPVNAEFTLGKRDMQTAKMWMAKAVALDCEAKGTP